MFSQYLQLWLTQTRIAVSQQLLSPSSTFLFVFGKVFRIFMYLLFIFFLVNRTGTLAGYSVNQVIFIFMTYILIDSFTQLFFRGVYTFRPLVLQGGFDYLLVQPKNILFRSLTRFTDIFDLFTTLIVFGYLIWFVQTNQLFFAPLHILLYFLLGLNAFLIGAAAHIAILAIGILYLEIDSALWLYRDLTAMGRFPIDIYQEPVRQLLTFVLPLGVMFLFPAKALFGLLSPGLVILSLFIGPTLVFLAYRYWQFALTRYSSASS